MYRGNVFIDTRPRRNLSTLEMREFWRHAEETAAEVDSWPEWKRAGIDIATERKEPRR